MTIQQLNRAQREQLKQAYYIECVNSDPSYNELADIDTLVTDRQLFEAYGDTEFTEDDFLC